LNFKSMPCQRVMESETPSIANPKWNTSDSGGGEHFGQRGHSSSEVELLGQQEDGG